MQTVTNIIDEEFDGADAAWDAAVRWVDWLKSMNIELTSVHVIPAGRDRWNARVQGVKIRQIEPRNP